LDEPVVVIVTEPEFYKAEQIFRDARGLHCVAAPAAEPELVEAIRRTGARAAIVGVQPYRDGLYAVLPNGGVLARFGVGHDGIDKAAATRAGILCTNTPDTLHQSVAELTMLLVLAASRHLPALASGMAQGAWRPQVGRELRGRSLAVIGRGRIGSVVMQIAREGFGMQVVCAGRGDDFAIAARDADFVSLHLPANAETHHFLNRETVAVLSPHAWVINTSRGSIVDEAALYDALASGRLAGAALDVFEREPYEPVDPSRDLRTLGNVIMTPHVGSNTVDANARMAARALRNVRLALMRNYASMDLLNPEVLEVLQESGNRNQDSGLGQDVGSGFSRT
jgi:phosphoglycerate dehydrogenase-like enzyme